MTTKDKLENWVEGFVFAADFFAGEKARPDTAAKLYTALKDFAKLEDAGGSAPLVFHRSEAANMLQQNWRGFFAKK